MKIKSLALGVAGAIAFGSAAFAERGSDGNVGIIYWQAPSILNPYLSGGTKDIESSSMVIEALAGYDNNGAMFPRLATEVPTVGNGGISSDLKSITWNIKPGILWSDGSPFTSADVLFTYDYCMGEAGCYQEAKFEGVTNVEALDDLTVKISFADPMPNPYGPFVGSQTPILQQAQFENCTGTRRQECTEENFGPIGTGPFVVTEFKPNDVIQLKANENYWMEGAPKVDGIVYQFGVDSDQKVNAMLSGDLDIVDNPDPNQLETLSAAGITVAKQPTNAKIRTWLNMNMAPFDNVHVRRALNYAVDRDELNNLVYGGLHTPASTGFFGPALGADHNPDFEGYTYDPQRALAELSLAGYPDGLEYDINTSNAPLNVAKDELIQAQYAKVGIKRNIIPKPSPDYYMEFWEEQIGAHSSGMSVRPDVWQQIAYIVNANGKSSGVLPGPDDEFRKAIDAGLSAVGEAYDPEDRKAAMAQLAQAYHDSAWGIDYLNSTYTVAMQKNITYTPSAIGKFYFGNGDIAIS